MSYSVGFEPNIVTSTELQRKSENREKKYECREIDWIP